MKRSLDIERRLADLLLDLNIPESFPTANTLCGYRRLLAETITQLLPEEQGALRGELRSLVPKAIPRQRPGRPHLDPQLTATRSQQAMDLYYGLLEPQHPSLKQVGEQLIPPVSGETTRGILARRRNGIRHYIATAEGQEAIARVRGILYRR